MTFKEAIELARSIINRFEKIEGKPWKIDGSMIELSKQVGDLSKLVMSYEGYYPKDRGKLDRQYLATKERIADELADLLFMIIRIAGYYGIDLEKAHIKARRGEDKYLKSYGA
jgi:NTP pyrophosphatase (non-canonical NTP hydrolase)